MSGSNSSVPGADASPVEALSFTVHSMPTPDLNADRRTRSGRLKMLLVAWGAVDSKDTSAASVETAESALRDPDAYGSALSIARAARYAASVIRERLTPQTWQLICRLETLIQETPTRPLTEAEILDCVDDALTTIAAEASRMAAKT